MSGTKPAYYGIIQTADLEEAIRVLKDELAKARSSQPVEIRRVDFGEPDREHAAVEYEVYAWRD